MVIGAIFFILLSYGQAGEVHSVVPVKPRLSSGQQIELSLGIPSPVTVGYWYQTSRSLWTGFQAGGFFLTPIEARSVGTYHAEIGGRYFPWDGGFFIGLLGGYRRIFISTQFNIQTGESQSEKLSPTLSIHTLEAVPHLGWHWNLGRRWRVGVEAGWVFPLWSRGSVGFSEIPGVYRDNGYAESLEQASQNPLSYIGLMPIPFLSVVRLAFRL